MRECPIKLDKIHCSTCHWNEGACVFPQKCALCGLEQPISELRTDQKNGKLYCYDRVECWLRFDVENKLKVVTYGV